MLRDQTIASVYVINALIVAMAKEPVCFSYPSVSTHFTTSNTIKCHILPSSSLDSYIYSSTLHLLLSPTAFFMVIFT